MTMIEKATLLTIALTVVGAAILALIVADYFVLQPRRAIFCQHLRSRPECRGSSAYIIGVPSGP